MGIFCVDGNHDFAGDIGFDMHGCAVLVEALLIGFTHLSECLTFYILNQDRLRCRRVDNTLQ